MHIHTHTCTHARTHACTRTRMHVHTHTRTYICCCCFYRTLGKPLLNVDWFDLQYHFLLLLSCLTFFPISVTVWQNQLKCHDALPFTFFYLLIHKVVKYIAFFHIHQKYAFCNNHQFYVPFYICYSWWWTNLMDVSLFTTIKKVSRCYNGSFWSRWASVVKTRLRVFLDAIKGKLLKPLHSCTLPWSVVKISYVERVKVKSVFLEVNSCPAAAHFAWFCTLLGIGSHFVVTIVAPREIMDVNLCCADLYHICFLWCFLN